MHPIAERIIAGETVCPGEIWAYNASRIIATERERARMGPHDPKTCRKKNCTHNIGSDIDYAVELAERAIRDCTCGEHR